MDDTEFVRVLRPRGLLRVLAEWWQLRTRLGLVRARGTTITAVAHSLTTGDRHAMVSSTEPDGSTWVVRVGAPETQQSSDVPQRG